LSIAPETPIDLHTKNLNPPLSEKGRYEKKTLIKNHIHKTCVYEKKCKTERNNSDLAIISVADGYNKSE
jgi:hypothetical protein